MLRTKRIPNFLRLRLGDWALLIEATASLAAASIAIKRLPFNRLMQEAGRLPHSRLRQRQGRDGDRARVAWAIEAAAKRVPWRTVCLHKGIAAQALLRRRRLPGTLYYGIKPSGVEGLSAHVWVTSAGFPIVGNETAHLFACVAAFPADGQG
jgi:hypothetical protein